MPSTVYFSKRALGETVRLVYRLAKPNGALVAPADIDSWTLNVYDQGPTIAPTVPLYTFTDASTPATSPPWYASLQLDAFAFDTIGYNFLLEVLPSLFLPKSGHTYRFDVVVTLTTGEKLPMLWDIEMTGVGSITL